MRRLTFLMIVIVACALCSGAWARVYDFVQENALIVCSDGGCDQFPTATNAQKRSSLKTAVDDALKPNSIYNIIYVTAGTHDIGSGLLLQISDAESKKTLTIQGVASRGVYDEAAPEEVIITGSNVTGALLETALPKDSTLVLKSLTITGGRTGILIRQGNVTIRGCYIRDNLLNGVEVSGQTKTARIENCSISRNGRNGVFVENSVQPADIAFCSILDNGGSGIRIADGAAVKVNACNICYNGKDSLSDADTGISSDDPQAKGLSGKDNNLYENGKSEQFYNVPVPKQNLKSLDEDPKLDSGPWRGKLLPGSPLIGRATNNRDKDLEDNDQEAQADIGADEVVTDHSSGGSPRWTGCAIDPSPHSEPGNPNPAEAVAFSTQQPGDLLVYLTVSGADNITASLGVDTDGDGIPDRFFRLDVYKTPGSGEFVAKNKDAIAQSGNVYPDGAGKVQVSAGSGPLDFQGPDLARKFVVDTIPPVLYVSESSGSPASSFFVSSNDNVTAAGCIGDMNHPGYPAYNDATNPTPITGGTIEANPNGLGAKMFFNSGSYSNGDAQNALKFSVSASFKDPAPPNKPNAAVSGFISLEEANELDETTVAQCITATDPFLVDRYGYPFPTWEMPKSAELDSTLSAGISQYFKPAGNTITITWVISPVAPFLLRPTPGDALHVATQFKPRDRAGNSADPIHDPLELWWFVDTQTDLIPNVDRGEVGQASFNWRLKRNSDVNPSDIKPKFAYRLMKKPFGNSFDEASGTWMWHGIYEPVTEVSANGWSTWDDRFTGANLSHIVAKYPDTCMLLVVVSMDEAGNVEPWPTALPHLGANVQVSSLLTTPDSNWCRFVYPTPETKVDTEVTPEFWYNKRQTAAVKGSYFDAAITDGETYFGDQRIIPMPEDSDKERIEANFQIRARRPEGYAGAVMRARVELELDGKVVMSSVLLLDHADRFNLMLPLFCEGEYVGDNLNDPYEPPVCDLASSPQDPGFGSHARTEKYLLRVWAYLDANSNGKQDLDSGEPVDRSPASLAFTITPGPIKDFVEQRMPDEQPVKAYEHVFETE